MAFTDALPDPRKKAQSAAAFGNVMDQLHHQHRLTDTGTTNNADLPAFHERRKEIYNFNTGFENLRSGGCKVVVLRRRFKDVTAHDVTAVQSRQAVNRLPESIKHPS